MDPYRELNKEKKLPFNFKMWLKTYSSVIELFIIFLIVVTLLGAGCYACNKYEDKRSADLKLSNEKFISFMEAKCSPGFYTEVKKVRDNIYRLKCSTENGKENEIVVKYPEEIDKINEF